MRESQVGEDLLFVHAGEGFDGFQLDQNRVTHDKVRAKAFIDPLPAKMDWNWPLPVDT